MNESKRSSESTKRGERRRRNDGRPIRISPLDGSHENERTKVGQNRELQSLLEKARSLYDQDKYVERKSRVSGWVNGGE